MANDEHVARLMNGVGAWNHWRNVNSVIPDSRKRTSRRRTSAGRTSAGGDLSGANLSRATLLGANLSGANLMGADLSRADLSANLWEANLRGANLRMATLVETNLTGADLTGCSIYGISAWGLSLEGAKQDNLLITPADEPAITVDNIEVAQFIYLLLHNEKIRNVIDTIGKKGVLLLGRFTGGRMEVLERLRDKLRDSRKHGRAQPRRRGFVISGKYCGLMTTLG
jgi:hypothetical protein